MSLVSQSPTVALEGIVTSASLTKSPDLWYNDGSIVVVGEDVGFRVYSGILAENATVFADVFSMPQPSSLDQETFEGCPVVRLTDSAYDTLQFLKATHSRRYYDASTIADLKITATAPRLSTKYGASELRQESISALRRSCPTTLDDYKNTITVPGFVNKPGEWFFMANLLREINVRFLLPVALYMCSRFLMPFVLDGALLDGTRVTLRPDNQRLVLCATPTLSALARTITLRCIFADFRLCPILICSKHRRALAKRYIEGRSPDGWVGPLLHFPGDLFRASGMCDPCVMEFAASTRDGSAAVWQKLPELFGLDNWETLLAEGTGSE